MTKRQTEVDNIARRLAEGTARKVYILTKEAWYADERLSREHGDHVWNIVVQSLTEDGEDDGCLGEFVIGGYDFRRNGVLSIRACVFQDGYPVLLAVPDLFPRLMSSEVGLTYEQVNAVLSGLGFKDVTQRQRPPR